MDYRCKTYSHLGDTEGWEGVGSYLHSRKAQEEEGVDVLGLLSW